MELARSTSTAPMGGESDPHAVVDAYGRVRQVSGLASWMLLLPESNPRPHNLTTLMVAARIAVSIR